MPDKNQAKPTTTNNVQILLGTNWHQASLPRAWATFCCGFGPRRGRSPAISIIGGVISLSLFRASATHGHQLIPETIAVEARIKRVRAELRDLCAAGTVILWGYLVGDAGYGVLQSIVIPELE